MTRHNTHTRTVLSLSALAMLITSGILHAGPIDPPVGPVTPTGKTTQEVFDKVAAVESRTAINAANTPGDADSLFKITTPGSYYLTGNITGVVGKHGIEIAANSVTLDLNGFELAGISGMGAFDGVSATVAALSNVAVVNGSVRSWGADGIDLASLFASNCRVEDVLAHSNFGSGISAGSGSTISNCSAFQNGTGISANTCCVVSNCSAYTNSGNGISTNSGCTVVGCSARLNTGDGIACVSACVITGNACSANSAVAGNSACIHAVGTDNRIEGNNCVGAARGIEVSLAGNFIIRNTCSGNTIDWVIAPNNIFGPIIDRRASTSAAVSGFAASSTLGSGDPNANFSY